MNQYYLHFWRRTSAVDVDPIAEACPSFTGMDVLLHPDKFDALPVEQRIKVIQHEAAHAYMNWETRRART